MINGRYFPCHCAACGRLYSADSLSGPVSTATKTRCCSMDCVREIDDRYYKALFAKPPASRADKQIRCCGCGEFGMPGVCMSCGSMNSRELFEQIAGEKAE